MLTAIPGLCTAFVFLMANLKLCLIKAGQKLDLNNYLMSELCSHFTGFTLSLINVVYTKRWVHIRQFIDLNGALSSKVLTMHMKGLDILFSNQKFSFHNSTG